MAKKSAATPASSGNPVNTEGGRVRRVIVYVGSDPKRDASMFYLNLFWCLMKQGQEQGIEMVPVIDTRPASQVVLEPPEVARIRRDGPVDGVIGFMMYPAMTTWMKESGLPWVVHCLGNEPGFVDFDHKAMLRDSLVRLAQLGCKTAGLMIPSDFTKAEMLEHLENVSAETGVAVNYEWILTFRDTQEQTGYAHLCALWDAKTRPDGLVVYPDRAARGVLSAIMEKRVRVPGELRLILHRNAESPYVSPVPCDWMEVSVAALADLLIDTLRDRWAGRTPSVRNMRMKLVKG